MQALAEYSPKSKLFVLIHKMDLIPVEHRLSVFNDRTQLLSSRFDAFTPTFFMTSIWDETLYRAWSSIVHSLIPNVNVIEAQLDEFSKTINASEVVLFERATFLVISNSTNREHRDVHRFEKISNIIKQFKLSCRYDLIASLNRQRAPAAHKRCVCQRSGGECEIWSALTLTDASPQ